MEIRSPKFVIRHLIGFSSTGSHNLGCPFRGVEVVHDLIGNHYIIIICFSLLRKMHEKYSKYWPFSCWMLHFSEYAKCVLFVSQTYEDLVWGLDTRICELHGCRCIYGL